MTRLIIETANITADRAADMETGNGRVANSVSARALSRSFISVVPVHGVAAIATKCARMGQPASQARSVRAGKWAFEFRSGRAKATEGKTKSPESLVRAVRDSRPATVGSGASGRSGGQRRERSSRGTIGFETTAKKPQVKMDAR